MMFYNLLIFLYTLMIRIVALKSKKASLWVSGRTDWQKKLTAQMAKRQSTTIWVHCASLGEFEQGRPIIESIKKQYPSSFIVLTFFSPSGYEVRKNYPLADVVSYLPADTPKQATQFIDIVQPDIVVMIKYEFWLNLLKILRQKQIPTLLVAAIFRKNQVFFTWYGKLWRNALQGFTHIFVQNQESADLLASINLKNFSIGGDTRFDRVVEIAQQFKAIAPIHEFCNAKKVLVAGSTWPADETLLAQLALINPTWKFIIAPHEIDVPHLTQLEKTFQYHCRFSHINTLSTKDLTQKQILIIDNIGMLSSLYHYATICYIGGGFGKGIHNTLEAAVYGKPVLFGPKYQKFEEAKALIQHGGAYAVTDASSLQSTFSTLDENEILSRVTSSISSAFVYSNAGATKLIMNYIKQTGALSTT
jgi:3-deoxy-D-manno-octulosonic-acid transferase